MNGNKFKGNKPKKSGRRRKEVYSEFDSNTDHYGRIVTLEGGKGISVLLLDNTDGKPIHVTIRGIHHKKVWFKKDELVVVRGSELWGKVSEGELNRVRRNFDRLEGKGDGNAIVFQYANDLDDEVSDDGSTKKVKPHTSINFNLDTADDLGTKIDIDAI